MPFKKGQSGNPKGRKRTGLTFADTVRVFLDGVEDGNKTRLQGVLEDLRRDKPEVLLHYGFGKPIDTQIHLNQESDGQIPQSLLDAAKALAKTL